ncbi:MAG: hypothetical protein N2049_00365 [Anaerolineales bacterium]|nr:hypothetical protein [Anaerolineales bacterium]MCX7607657.1 hypothetical protein [Anaerolineales bacterium]
MDLTQITQFLAPLLPYLLKGGIELAKSAAGELGKKLSADGWEGLKKLAEKIQKKASDPVVKQVGDDDVVVAARFTTIPNDNCYPGIHYGVLSIVDTATQVEIVSLSFSVRVEDFAFDHVSRPLFSKITSVALGFGSLVMFILSALEQIDKTLGMASGTAFAFLASAVLLRLWNMFHRPTITHAP